MEKRKNKIALYSHITKGPGISLGFYFSGGNTLPLGAGMKAAKRTRPEGDTSSL